jgi:hypothetical protein
MSYLKSLRVPADPAAGATLTDNTNRTPSTTNPTLAFIVLDWNGLAGSTTVTIIVTVGARTFATYNIANQGVGAVRMGYSLTILVPANTAYKVDVSNVTGLTMTAHEQVI